jgi:hypothetical protein
VQLSDIWKSQCGQQLISAASNSICLVIHSMLHKKYRQRWPAKVNEADKKTADKKPKSRVELKVPSCFGGGGSARKADSKQVKKKICCCIPVTTTTRKCGDRDAAAEHVNKHVNMFHRSHGHTLSEACARSTPWS